jgi:hypothetical protein
MRSIYFILIWAITQVGVAQDLNKTQSYYKEVIEFLASDSLEGRLTGMPGELISAKFIKEKMQDAGLKAPTDSGYFQKFKYTYLRIPSSLTKLVIGFNSRAIDAKFGEDFFVVSQSSNEAKANNQIYDAGYGLDIPKLKYSDYDNYQKSDSGKVFVIKIGHPEKDNPHSYYGMYSSISNKIKWAKERGACAILFHNPDKFDKEPIGPLKKTKNISTIPIVFTKLDLGDLSKVVEVGMQVKIATIEKEGHNVIGVVRRNKRKKYIVIGAHHDHIGRAELGNSRAKGQEIHNGADDNASGVAMMLHLAKRLKNHRSFRKYNLLFVAFSGEELGLLGSKYFVNNCPIDTSKIVAMVNFDMVGRLNLENHTAVINGVGTSPYWTKRIKRIKLDTSQLKMNTTDGGVGASDHTSFYLAGIPAVHLFSGQHRDYHMPEDDVEKINYQGMDLLEDFIVKLMCKIPRRNTFTPTKNSNKTPRGFKVTLGVMPDYTFGGEGMRLDNVSEGKTADKAGLKRNDIITQLGTHSVTSVEDYMHALSHFNKGDTTTLTILRDGKTITKTIKFE